MAQSICIFAWLLVSQVAEPVKLPVISPRTTTDCSIMRVQKQCDSSFMDLISLCLSAAIGLQTIVPYVSFPVPFTVALKMSLIKSYI